jgi:hypothetical protein
MAIPTTAIVATDSTASKLENRFFGTLIFSLTKRWISVNIFVYEYIYACV